jgi:hypothetical protein
MRRALPGHATCEGASLRQLRSPRIGSDQVRRAKVLAKVFRLHREPRPLWPCPPSRSPRDSAADYNPRRKCARRQRIQPRDALSSPAKSDGRTAARGTAFRIGLPVQDVEKRDRLVVTPEADDPVRRLRRIGANEASAVEEPNVLISAVARPAVPIQCVEAQASAPHLSRDLSPLGRAPLVDEPLSPKQSRILSRGRSQSKDQSRAQKHHATDYRQYGAERSRPQSHERSQIHEHWSRAALP